MARAGLALQLTIVAAAAALFAVPLPATLVERYYARVWYPGLQARVTAWSNTTGVSLFDVLLLFVISALLLVWAVRLREAWRRRTVRPIARAALASIVVASAMYIWFALAWGLNYSRAPLEAAIGYEPSRMTPASVRALAERSVREVNRWYAAAHATGFPERGEVPATLAAALHEVERRLGRERPTVPGRPKRTLLAPFFVASGVDGLHAPFLLETLLNPELTPPERPAVLAHEWAHMAGYAPEDDASFVGLVAALRADPASRYSAWLTIFGHAARRLPRDEQRRLVAALDPGPQADRRAIAERLTARVAVVAEASWQTYDQYLRAQGVTEGVESYGRVLQLLIGSGAIDWP